MKLHLFKNLSEGDLIITKQKRILKSLNGILRFNHIRARNLNEIKTTISQRYDINNSETKMINNTIDLNSGMTQDKNRNKKFKLITGLNNLNKLHSSNSEIIISKDKSNEKEINNENKNKNNSIYKLKEIFNYKSRNKYYEKLKKITYTFSQKKKQIIKTNLSSLKFKGISFPNYLKENVQEKLSEKEKEENKNNNNNNNNNNRPIEKKEADKILSVYANEEIDNDTNELKKSAHINIYITPEFGKTNYSDKKSYNIFYQKSFKDNEIIRKGGLEHQTPSFNLIRASNKFRVPPNPIGVLKKKGEKNSINLKNKIVGDNYLKCLNESLKISSNITKLNLEKNRLSDLSLIPLLKTVLSNNFLLEKLIEINLSYNKIGIGSIELLVKYISNVNCFLQNLNMENNLLGVINAKKIIEAISNNLRHEIKYLNLSKNLLDDNVAFELGNLIKICENLKVLILYQNQLSNKGGGILMKEIKNHTGLKILDLSWNLLGENLSDEPPSLQELLNNNFNKNNTILNNAYLNEIKYTLKLRQDNNISLNEEKSNINIHKIGLFTSQLCSLFHNKQSELLHLDISYNNLNYPDCKAISEHIKYNHTILGIHVDGNDMYTDGFGFIYPVNKSEYKEDHYAKSQIFYRISDEHPLISSNIIKIKKLRAKNNCWICEGWREIVFNYKPNDISEEKNDKIKLFLNFENYRNINFNELNFIKNDFNESESIFQCCRVCPPGDLYFFLSRDGVPLMDYGRLNCNLKESIIYTGDEKSKSNEKNLKNYIITKVAHRTIEINSEVINTKNYKSNLEFCVPRPEYNKKLIHIEKKFVWKFTNSIWSYYGYNILGEPEEILNAAFEFDYARCNFDKDKDTLKLNMEEKIKIKNFLKENYKKIIDTYKILSGNSGYKIWQIDQNQLTEFAQNCDGLIDTKYLINDFLVKVTEVNSNFLDKSERKNNINIPEKNIIRHQFLMLLVKIAKDKYYRTKQIEKLNDAIEYAFINNYENYLNKYQNNKWRVERYYLEEIDNFIKAHIPILDALYYSFAPQQIIGKSDSYWMTLDNFTQLCNRLMDSDFPVKDIPMIFNISIRLVIDEIHSDKQYHMLFPEFLEALCRFIDKLSPIPNGQEKSKWDLNKRHNQTLLKKLETMLPFLIKLIKDKFKNVRDKFVLPKKDKESGKYIINYENTFYKGKLPMKNNKN